MLLLQFAALQALDALTTLWFLHRGVAEANPLMGWLMAGSAQPAWGLVTGKVLGLVPACWAWRSGRYVLLRRVNLLFAGFIVWNLVAVGLAGS